MIGVVIVLYNPNSNHINAIVNLKQTISQEELLIVIDNSDIVNDILYSITDNFFIYRPLLKNTGIAYAQNVGIRDAISNKCSHIVFFDQDSIITSEYLINIVNEYIRIEISCPKLFLLGPTVYNLESYEEYRSVIHKKQGYQNIKDFFYQRDLISSGSCVCVNKITEVGILDDSLFIDGVDFEWCWRAVNKGFINGITTNVTLLHKVGQRELKLPFNYKVIISAPIRYFYQYRNYLWLVKRSYVPKLWKINTGIKYISRLIYFPFVLKDGLMIEKYMWKGIIVGLGKS